MDDDRHLWEIRWVRDLILLLGVGLLLGYEQIALGVILAVASVTIVQRTAHVWRNADH